jgi:serine/threonine protein kinase
MATLSTRTRDAKPQSATINRILSGNGPGDRRDVWLVKMLTSSPSLTLLEVEAMLTWWLAERAGTEGLAGFLVRQRIFVPAAARSLENTTELMQKGHVTFSDAIRFFTNEGLERIRARLPADTQGAPDEPSRGRAAGKRLLPGQWSADPGQHLPPLEIGTRLGKYLLTERLGQGSCGLVFRALHTGLNIPVAVKVWPRNDLGSESRMLSQLRAEAQLLGQLFLLNHPNIVRVLDFEEFAEFPYMVLEYVEGMSLAELILQSGRLRLDRALRIIVQVAEALAAAHRLGVVHRDVKPGNILVTKDGQAKLADLGLAVIVGTQNAPATPTTGMAGTVAYMSPEQAGSAMAVDHRSDIYGLGATFYHAVTGQMPFTGRSAMEVMLKHAQEPAVPPHQLATDLDPAASEIILQMLAKKAAERHQTYDELIKMLANLQARVTTRALVPTPAGCISISTVSMVETPAPKPPGT